MKTLVVLHVMKVLCSLVVTPEHVRVMEVGVVMILYVRVSNFSELYTSLKGRGHSRKFFL